jgi:hypothetical protein
MFLKDMKSSGQLEYLKAEKALKNQLKYIEQMKKEDLEDLRDILDDKD